MNKKKGFNLISFEWHSILRDIVRNFWTVVLSVLIALMSLYIAEHSVYSPEYTSTAIVAVNVKSGNYITYLDINTASEMAKVFSEVFVQPSMKEKAVENLGAESFDGIITASVMSETNFVQIKVTAKSPDTAYNLLHSVLEVYPNISDNIFDNAVVRIVKNPQMPTGPSNSISKGKTNVVAAVAAVLSLAVIVVLSVLRDTVKTESSFVQNIDADLLGSIPHEKKKNKFKDRLNHKKSSLLVNGTSLLSLGFTESYQKIVTKIEYMNSTEGDKVFAVVSVAENEGKSTAASNIAMMLANRGNKVILFDLDEKKPALYKIFEIKKENEEAEIGSLLEGKIKIEDYKFRRFRNTSLFMALNTKAHADSHKFFENGKVKEILDYFKKIADYVIVDTAPISVDSSVTEAVMIADKTIMVVRNDAVKISSINDALLTIRNVGGEIAGCVFNDVDPEFSMFGQSGYDESGYYNKNYGYYGKYSYKGHNKYSNYSNYSRYSNDNIEQLSQENMLLEEITEIENGGEES